MLSKGKDGSIKNLTERDKVRESVLEMVKVPQPYDTYTLTLHCIEVHSINTYESQNTKM